MLIVVSNRKRNTYRYRRKLFGFGLQYAGNKWSLQTSDDDLIQCVKRYCKRKHLAFESIEDKYVRSTDYRKNFLQQYQIKNGKYFRCAYCGKKLTTQKVTVDHIIPIDKVQHQKHQQWRQGKKCFFICLKRTGHKCCFESISYGSLLTSWCLKLCQNLLAKTEQVPNN